MPARNNLYADLLRNSLFVVSGRAKIMHAVVIGGGAQHNERVLPIGVGRH